MKGRDFYDFRWYVERGVPIDIRCLESRLDKKMQSCGKTRQRHPDHPLKNRFETLDWDSAREDVINFIEPLQLGDWNKKSFKDLADRIVVLEE